MCRRQSHLSHWLSSNHHLSRARGSRTGSPFGSYLHCVYSDFGIVLLGFELQLHVQQGDLGGLVLLGLHFKPSVRESLLKGDSGHQLGVLEDRDLCQARPPKVFSTGLIIPTGDSLLSEPSFTKRSPTAASFD